MKTKQLTIALAVLVTAFCFITPVVYAQDVRYAPEGFLPVEGNVAPEFIDRSGDQALMTAVVLQKLTLWTRPRDGHRIYARSCRSLRGGCEQSIEILVGYIFEEARRQDFDPWLLAAVAWHESRFNPFAVSHAEAYGILQFLRRSPWSRGLPFVRQHWYRERCRRDRGACQRPIVERSIYWIQRSSAYCGSIERGLRMYNSGRCSGSQRYTRVVFTIQRDLLRRAEIIRSNNYVDPERPQDGAVFLEDALEDCAEPTLEEYLCDEGLGSCDVVGIRTNCLP